MAKKYQCIFYNNYDESCAGVYTAEWIIANLATYYIKADTFRFIGPDADHNEDDTMQRFATAALEIIEANRK